jgi:hypothetical protein
LIVPNAAGEGCHLGSIINTRLAVAQVWFVSIPEFNMLGSSSAELVARLIPSNVVNLVLASIYGSFLVQ